MKAKSKKERTEIWWTMVHALDFIKFSYLENLEDEELKKAKEAYYNLMDLSNIYHDATKEQ